MSQNDIIEFNSDSLQDQDDHSGDDYVHSASHIPSSRKNGDVTDTTDKIKKVFEYYTQFGDRMNSEFIKSHKFVKLAEDAGILSKSVTQSKVEIIFLGENNHKPQMSFDTFLNSLVKVAELKYRNAIGRGELSFQEALNNLLNDHILPLYDQIYVKPPKNDPNSQLFNFTVMRNTVNNLQPEDINGDIEQLFFYNFHTLYDVYKVYFPWEVSLTNDHKYVKEESMKAFFSFIKDFDLSPALISKSGAFQAYKSELETPNSQFQPLIEIFQSLNLVNSKQLNNKHMVGMHFSFFRFIRCILKIASYGLEKLEFTYSKKLSLFEKISLTFERMELSSGFSTIEAKTAKTHSAKSTSLIPREFIERVKYAIMDAQEFAETKGDFKNKPEKSILSKSKRLLNSSKAGEIFEHAGYIADEYGEDLIVIYTAICSFGDPLNTHFMNAKKFVKFLKEAKLVKSEISKKQDMQYRSLGVKPKKEKGLKMNEIDPIFFRLTQSSENLMGYSMSMAVGNASRMNTSKFNQGANNQPVAKMKKGVNANSKIDYNMFVNSLEVVAKAVYGKDFEDMQEAIDTLLKKHVIPLKEKFFWKNTDYKRDFLKEKQSNKELSNLIAIMAKAFYTPYTFYCDYNELLDFDCFLK